MLINMRSADALGFHEGAIAMTRIAATSGSVATNFDTAFSSLIVHCAEFRAGVRQGRDIEQRYYTLNRRSRADLARLGLNRTDIARIALTGSRH